MAAVGAWGNFYLYGYTDKSVAGDDRYFRDAMHHYREIEWCAGYRTWQVQRAFLETRVTGRFRQKIAVSAHTEL
jgi:hypothetical protein